MLELKRTLDAKVVLSCPVGSEHIMQSYKLHFVKQQQ